MISGDEHDPEALHEEGAVKKRRLYGACDMCRKKKSASFDIVDSIPEWLKLLSGSSM